jgi:UDP-N-acetylglucosamine--N-acetylmuramyl-(pentapeptide) pyrophosphoryl-undecaprenol N-acetylglucosamine transferase
VSRSILIMAGGTGGHIFPALAVADILRAQGWKVTWLGAHNSMEAELIPRHKYEMAWVRFSGVRGKGVLRLLRLPFDMLVAMWQSGAAILRHRPDVVLGMGGYITVPGGIVAALLRRPLVIHEQNSIAGLGNKVLARLAQKVMSGFPDVLPRAIWCGNPVRKDIAALPEPQQRYGARSGRLNVLVVGGSLGAKAINEALPRALALLPQDERPSVLHQTGKQHFEAVKRAYQQAGVQADIKPFMDEMARHYGNADLVICRAGALTVAELAAAGVASILIPFPYAVDDHQTRNAQFLSKRGAAVLLPQGELSAEKLAKLLQDLGDKERGREKLLTMAQHARGLAKADAAVAVAAICGELAG